MSTALARPYRSISPPLPPSPIIRSRLVPLRLPSPKLAPISSVLHAQSDSSSTVECHKSEDRDATERAQYIPLQPVPIGSVTRLELPTRSGSGLSSASKIDLKDDVDGDKRGKCATKTLKKGKQLLSSMNNSSGSSSPSSRSSSSSDSSVGLSLNVNEKASQRSDTKRTDDTSVENAEGRPGKDKIDNSIDEQSLRIESKRRPRKLTKKKKPETETPGSHQENQTDQIARNELPVSKTSPETTRIIPAIIEEEKIGGPHHSLKHLPDLNTESATISDLSVLTPVSKPFKSSLLTTLEKNESESRRYGPLSSHPISKENPTATTKAKEVSAKLDPFQSESSGKRNPTSKTVKRSFSGSRPAKLQLVSRLNDTNVGGDGTGRNTSRSTNGINNSSEEVATQAERREEFETRPKPPLTITPPSPSHILALSKLGIKPEFAHLYSPVNSSTAPHSEPERYPGDSYFPNLNDFKRDKAEKLAKKKTRRASTYSVFPIGSEPAHPPLSPAATPDPDTQNPVSSYGTALVKPSVTRSRTKLDLYRDSSSSSASSTAPPPPIPALPPHFQAQTQEDRDVSATLGTQQRSKTPKGNISGPETASDDTTNGNGRISRESTRPWSIYLPFAPLAPLRPFSAMNWVGSLRGSSEVSLSDEGEEDEKGVAGEEDRSRNNIVDDEDDDDEDKSSMKVHSPSPRKIGWRSTSDGSIEHSLPAPEQVDTNNENNNTIKTVPEAEPKPKPRRWSLDSDESRTLRRRLSTSNYECMEYRGGSAVNVIDFGRRDSFEYKRRGRRYRYYNPAPENVTDQRDEGDEEKERNRYSMPISTSRKGKDVIRNSMLSSTSRKGKEVIKGPMPISASKKGKEVIRDEGERDITIGGVPAAAVLARGRGQPRPDWQPHGAGRAFPPEDNFTRSGTWPLTKSQAENPQRLQQNGYEEENRRRQSSAPYVREYRHMSIDDIRSPPYVKRKNTEGGRESVGCWGGFLSFLGLGERS